MSHYEKGDVLSMTKKKTIFTIGILSIFIMAIIICVILRNQNNTIESLMNNFEHSINNNNKQQLIECYPYFMEEELNKLISDEKMTDFYNTVVSDSKIDIDIFHQNECNLTEIKKIESEINNKYGISVSVDSYEILAFKYHKGFGDDCIQVIKIQDKWYLYADAYYGFPVQYFIN